MKLCAAILAGVVATSSATTPLEQCRAGWAQTQHTLNDVLLELEDCDAGEQVLTVEVEERREAPPPPPPLPSSRSGPTWTQAGVVVGLVLLVAGGVGYALGRP